MTDIKVTRLGNGGAACWDDWDDWAFTKTALLIPTPALRTQTHLWYFSVEQQTTGLVLLLVAITPKMVSNKQNPIKDGDPHPSSAVEVAFLAPARWRSELCEEIVVNLTRPSC